MPDSRFLFQPKKRLPLFPPKSHVSANQECHRALKSTPVPRRVEGHSFVLTLRQTLASCLMSLCNLSYGHCLIAFSGCKYQVLYCNRMSQKWEESEHNGSSYWQSLSKSLFLVPFGTFAHLKILIWSHFLWLGTLTINDEHLGPGERMDGIRWWWRNPAVRSPPTPILKVLLVTCTVSINAPISANANKYGVKFKHKWVFTANYG